MYENINFARASVAEEPKMGHFSSSLVDVYNTVGLVKPHHDVF